ncbi:germin-like protein 1-3 [Selaginella moellendorffii]|uniref:germin-like protein 1-3 n=1 Tax=Selaginella moellendorffii TaxID=88036 RepID=UPI000D1CC875|nr:germin-like protein 1-3 [Selaginella moellendorffii]|eukprot:XP_024517257.1 germin-like protein 1-3 [Selaginella moellendorffii]
MTPVKFLLCFHHSLPLSMAEVRAFVMSMMILLVTLASFAGAADPDPLTDFASSTAENNFPYHYPKPQQQQSPDSSKFVVRDVFKNGDVSNGPGGVRAGLSTKIFPAMDSQGLTYVHFNMTPCGVNLPHTHPRATEMLTMVSGGPLQVGFVDTEGKPHINVLHPGDVTIFPRGMLHFEVNVGTEQAFYISALNSQNPGTLTSGGALFNVPARALAAALNQDLASVSKIKDTIFKYSSQLQMTPPNTCVPGKDVTTTF